PSPSSSPARPTSQTSVAWWQVTKLPVSSYELRLEEPPTAQRATGNQQRATPFQEAEAGGSSQPAPSDPKASPPADSGAAVGWRQRSSTAMATASPPPIQRESTPIRAPRFFIAYSSVTRVLAPLAPIGWPRATA